MPQQNLKAFLEHKAYNLRVNSLVMTTKAGSGHPTSALSAADIVAALFFYAMRYDPSNIDNPNNDRFILSKGHASPVFYSAWKEVGVISDKELYTYREIDSVLEGHPTRRFKYTEAATGSLGMGLSIGAGMSLSAKMDKRSFFTYVLMGDAETNEGSIWEAAEIAAYYKLNNLVAILDCNRLGQSAPALHEHHLQRYADKFHAFGWHPIVIDGHDMYQIIKALDKAREHTDSPTIIIAKTIKGYGVAQAEDILGFHGKAFTKEEIHPILQQLEQRFHEAAFFDESLFSWKPTIPEAQPESKKQCDSASMHEPRYKISEELATRKAYGQALTALGAVCKDVISLDGEVKNSTYAEIFEEKYPDRFIQCFVAEQNMVSMAVGLERRGKIPFVSTFASFFSRAYDQIRMAAIGTSSLRLVGSHAGVSIGQDGPSQMGLEDLSMMQAIPHSLVLYPCDAVSTYKLVAQMAKYTQGMSYLRTTRMNTPVIYDLSEEFPIGGCKIIKQSDKDSACIIGAGVTLHEALKAYEQLAAADIYVAVIDLYSIKPLDSATIIEVSQKAQGNIITVEDHYLEGGLGQAVSYAVRNQAFTIECLAVKEVPRSGKPEELLALMKIDAAAIVSSVKKMLKA